MYLAQANLILAQANLVPSYDVLGLPMPSWLAQFLMALTLALHWAFLAMTAGGAVAYVLSPREPAPGQVPLRKALAVYLPLSLATAMTLGVAPLLFVQVLYGQFFYTANILMGYVWLSLLVLMIANLYLLYYGWQRVRAGRSARPVGIAVLALMAVSAMILSANATLTQSPDAWDAFRAKGGVAPYMGDATFWPRWLTALSGLLAGGGLFVAVFSSALSRQSPEGARAGVIRSLCVSLVGLAGMIGFGLWAAAAAGRRVGGALTGGPEAVFAYAAAGALVVTAVLVLLAMRGPSLGKLIVPGVTFVVALLGMAAARDTARRAALADQFDLASAPVRAQWASFALFAVVFVGGLGLVAYIVKLAYATKNQGRGAAA